MARGVLAEGRLLDAARMIEPLIEPTSKRNDSNGRVEASQLMLRCLITRVHLLRHGDNRKAFDLLGDYETSESRSDLELALRAEVALWLGWSKVWQDDDRYDDARALNLLEEAERGFAECMNPSGRCWTRIAQAHAYFTIDEYQLMLQALHDAAVLQERLNDVTARAWIDHLSVAGARFEGRYQAARRHAESLEAFGKKFHDDNALGRSLAHRAVVDYELGRPPEHIIATATKAESILRRSIVNPGYSLLSAYHAHIGALIRSGAWREAEQTIDDALEHIGFLGTAPAYITLHRARLREYRGETEAALELLDDISRTVDRQHRLLASSVSHVRAGVLQRMGRSDQARESAEKALRSARDAGHVGYELRALLDNARVAVEQSDEESARRFIREADSQADYFSILPLAAQRFLNHGRVSVLRNRSDEARAYFTQALSAYSLIGDVYAIASVQCELAGLGADRVESRNFAEGALRTFEKVGAAPDAKRARELLRTAPPQSVGTVAEHEANIGAIMARAAISVDLVAEAWLQAAEELAPGRWLVVYRFDEDETWSLVHKHGELPDDLTLPNPSLDRICEDGVDWMRLRGLPVPAFFFGMECGGDEDPACAAIEKRLEPWIPVVGLALEHALLRSSRLSVSSSRTNGDHPVLGTSLSGYVFGGSATRNVAKQIRSVRSGHSPVLITGESGVGKERAARAIHETGDRKNAPFVLVRCTDRPAEVLDSLLFGTDPGNTGALLSADGGILYLEEISELPFEAQSRLLHFLEEGTVSPEDGASVAADVRIIASSTKNLRQMVREGHFREDLYYRLNVVPIHIPPLRERQEDIPLLVQHFLNELTAGKSAAASVTSRAIDTLIRYDWPGNVRQLRNEIDRLIQMAGSEPFSMIDVEDLSPSIRDGLEDQIQLDAGGNVHGFCLDGKGLDDILAVAEKSVIEQVLSRNGGQVSSAADDLGLSRQGLYKKMKRLGIEPSKYQAGSMVDITASTTN